MIQTQDMGRSYPHENQQNSELTQLYHCKCYIERNGNRCNRLLLMNNTVYLRSGDLVTISFEGAYLSVQSLTQSVPALHDILANPFCSYFLLSTQKCLERSIIEQKPLDSYKEDQICYGESVILVHLLSGKYLSYSKDIQTRSTLELIGTFRDCCKFTIRPIFKCQTVVTRRVRNQESVIFSPSEVYNREGTISLCAQKNEGRTRSHVLLKKNQYTRFLLSRKNSPNLRPTCINNLHIFQLSNIETRKNLHMTVSQIKHRDIVAFEKNINEHGSFFDLRPVNNLENTFLGIPEQSIEYQTHFYIHSWREDKYLSVNMIGDVCLVGSPSEDGQFFIQAYNDEELNLGSAIRVKHASSNKYLSLSSTSSQIQMIPHSRLIDTFQFVRVPVEDLRLNVFVNDAHDIILKELNEGILNYRNKRNIQKVLKQLINFIYGEEVTLTQFLNMKSQIVCRLSSQDQKLLAEVGIIHTLVKLCRIFIEESTRQAENVEMERRDRSEQLNIISYIMMSIVGICTKNPPNTKIFVQEMPLLYECIGLVSGIIQCFYHLFKDSKELLLILENTTHRIEKKQYASIEVLIEQISNQNFDFQTRAKIMRLLEALIGIKQGDKIQLHEAYLLNSLKERKLDNVLLSLKPSDHHDLLIYVDQKQKYEELDAMLELKRNYEKQLVLVKEQLELFCSLCLNSTSQAFEYVSAIISEEMILRYLKVNLHPQFKQIFMKLLLDVYLSSLASHNYTNPEAFILTARDVSRDKQFSRVEDSNLRMKLIENQQGQQMQEMAPSHSKTIQKIQNLILDGTKKAIINEIIDSSFYMNIKALRKFLQIRILDQQEVVEFRVILVQFITRYSKQSFKQQQKKFIILQILKIIKDYFLHQIHFMTENFVQMISNENIPLNKIYERFKTFLGGFPAFESERIEHDFGFIADLIRQSIYFQDKDIFQASTNIMKLVNQRFRYFIQQLKDRIIIDSKWSTDLYNRINRTKKGLKKEIHEYMANQNDKKKIDSSEQQINQLIGQLNYMFYENADSSNKFSTLTQNIYREMDLLEILVGFLNDSQKKFKEARKGKGVDIYAACFEFISMYLVNNQSNFFRFQAKYLDIKFVFEHADRGQVKFLNHLVKMPRARQLMLDEIMGCLFLSFEHNTQPNPFTLLGLINAISFPSIDKNRIDGLVEYLTSNPASLLSILKMTEKRTSCYFTWSYNPEKPNYHKDWLLYLTLIFHLFLMILQNCTERTSISLEIKKYLKLAHVLELFEIKDLISNASLQCLEGTLLKKKLMKFFQKLYINQLNKNPDQIQTVLSLIQNLFQNLTYMREDVMGASTLLIESVLSKSNDHEAIIYEFQIQDSHLGRDFQFNFNSTYMSLVVYYPFLIKVLDTVNTNTLLGQGESILKKEVSILQDSIYRKFKDFVHSRLTYGQYNRKAKDYLTSITNCEQILKRKIGFNMAIEEDEDGEQIEQSQKSDIFLNMKLENTVKCYQFASNPVEKKIYENFIFIFHSHQFRDFLQEQENQMTVVLSEDQIAKLIEFLIKILSLRTAEDNQMLKHFLFLLRFNANQSFNISLASAREVMMSILENQKDDPSNKKLLAYLSITRILFASQIFKEPTNKIKKQTPGLFKQDVLDRIAKVLLREQSLYSGSKLEEQAMIYSQRKLLSFEKEEGQLNIEICLEWIRSLSLLTSEFQKIKYLSLFMEVVDLLKTYSFFISSFNSKYITFELYEKINLCLEIIFHYIAGLSKKNAFINYLIQRQIWNDLNLILALDDGWTRNMDQFSDSQVQTFLKSERNQLRGNSRLYLFQAKQLYMNSRKFYGAIIPESYYPLLPRKSFFGEMKANVIAILKQFKHYQLQIKKQLFSRLDMNAINANICEVYMKHNSLFSKFDIPSVEVDIDFRKPDEWQDIAFNMSLENGVDLTSIKIDMEDTAGNSELKIQYNNLRLEAITSKKIQSAFSTLFAFIRDFFLLFVACFLRFCRRKNKRSDEHIALDAKKMKEILNFFLTKMGRVEVCGPDTNQLLVIDFLVRPECATNKDVNKKFIESINFVSMQLKVESIYRQSQRFLLYYQNQIKFFRRFNRVYFINFLTKNFDMITYLNFAVVVAQNIVLIANSDSDEAYFIDRSLNQPFVWLQIINTGLAGLIMLAYCLKDVPLLIQNVNLKLKIRSEAYGSNYNSTNVITKFFIKAWMVCLDPTFAYHIIYSLIVGLVFYNKLFAALLLLDVFFQIPNLKNLLMSIWRPKIELILAIVSFILVQYFFSIFMFFNFKSRTFGYCDTLGSCFGFVFVTTYKAVGGFVGFLFLRGGAQIPNVDFFQVFQDVYVVLIFQIFFALILAIIIDTFSLIRNEQTVRQQYLDGCCIVCNLDKTRFNSSNMNFRAHIAITHNIWNYFYYTQYIKHKSALKRASYERHIFLSPNANWLPSNTSKDVEEDEMK